MKITRAEKKLVLICALAICVPLGAAAFISHINATPAIPATSYGPPPNPNGYDLYVRASNAIKPANPPVDANLDPKIIADPKLRAQRYSVARKDAWLAQNKAGFALFEKAQQAESLAPPYGASDQAKAMRQLGRYKVIESNAHWQRGEPYKALQSGLDILELGRDVQRGGDAGYFITGSAIGGMSRRATSDTIELLNAQQARLAARRLEKMLSTNWTLEQASAEDKARFVRNWSEYFEHPNWRAAFIANRAQMSAKWGTWAPAPLTWKERLRVHTISKRQVIADLDAAYERGIANARAPYGIEVQPLAPANPLIDSVEESLTRIRFSAARDQTADRVLLLRLALRAYQLERGAPPPNLKTLAPAYLQSVPLDPFGKGAPFRYETEGVNYVLWSIGPDGRDDGGKPIVWRNQKANRKLYADERARLPPIWWDDAVGDYVAGKNHGKY